MVITMINLKKSGPSWTDKMPCFGKRYRNRHDHSYGDCRIVYKVSPASFSRKTINRKRPGEWCDRYLDDVNDRRWSGTNYHRRWTRRP